MDVGTLFRARRRRSRARSTPRAAAARSSCSPTSRGSTARRSRCAVAARVRRRDRARGGQLRRADRLLRRVALPRRRVRRVLPAAEREPGDGRGPRLARVGHRRCPGRRGRVRARRRAGRGARPPRRRARRADRGRRCGRARAAAVRAGRAVVRRAVRERGELAAAEFDATHSVERAVRMGSVRTIIEPATLRPYLIDAVERGIERALDGHIGGG